MKDVCIENLNNYLLEKNTNEVTNYLHSSSLSTHYESESGELTNINSIEDNFNDNMNKILIEENKNDENNQNIDYHDILEHLVIKIKNLGTNNQMCNSLNEIFTDFCNIENQYIEKLKILIDKIDLKCVLDYKQNISILSSFKSYITKMAENHSDFLDSISNECFLESKNKELMEINNEIEKLRKELENYKSNRLINLGKMQDSYYKAKNAVTLCLDATHQAPSIKMSVHKTIIPVILNFLEVNNVIHKYDEFNYFLEFSKKIDTIINSLVEFETKRSYEINDVIGKFMIYETSKIRNLQYDLNSLIETLNNFQVQDFNKELESKLNCKMPTNNARKYVEFSKSYLRQNSSKIFIRTTIEPPPYRVIEKIQKGIQRFLDCLWKEGQIVSLNEFTAEIQSSLVRQVFCDMLSKSASSHTQLKSREKFQLLADMVNAVLFVSERQADYWCGYSILKFSDKFHSPIDGSGDKKTCLWYKINSNNYWKSIVFWEECLAIIVSLDLKALFETSSCLNRPIDKIECIPSTESALSFYKWVLRYGIPQQECESLVYRVCNKLKVPQSYINTLLGQK